MINIEILPLGPMANCTYLLTQEKEALLIDPAWDMQTIENTLAAQHLHLCGVLFTHGHFDHVKFSQPLLEKYQLQAYLEKSDEVLAGIDTRFLHLYSGDQTFQIGPFPVQILSTPGHTAGSVCILVEDALFTGDTLFVGACGRVDLPSSDPRAMLASLRRLAQLPNTIRVFAGHSYNGTSQTTIGHEKQTNPFVKNALRGELF